MGLVADEKFSAESKLQSYLTARIEKFLNERGKKIIGWDEIIEGGLAPNATVMSWRGEKGGVQAARMGHKVIMAPNSNLYFDYYQTENTYTEPLAYPDVNSISEVYNYEPVPTALSAEEIGKIWGVQANLWVEMISRSAHVEYMTLPRLAALSEVQWSLPEKKNYSGFINRLQYLTTHYSKLGYNFSIAAFEPDVAIKENKESASIELAMSTSDKTPIHYTLDGTIPTKNSNLYDFPIAIDSLVEVKARAFRNVEETNTNLYQQTFEMHKGVFKNIELQTGISQYFNAPKGKNLLLDGRRGNGAHVFGDVTSWLGFGRQMSVVIDLEDDTDISSVVTSILLHPNTGGVQYRVSLSDDGESFNKVFDERIEFKAIADLVAPVGSCKGRYVKIEIEADGATHVLSDEIFIK